MATRARQRASQTRPRADPRLAAARRALAGPSRPLDQSTATGPRHDLSLSHVRVHRGDDASNTATAVLAARAFSYGHHVVLGRDVDEHTPRGAATVAHELAHVAQRSTETGPPQHIAAADSAEERAARAGQQVTSTQPAGTLFLERDPTKAALYPTAGERTQILGQLNPEQQQAAETGAKDIPAVSDPTGFCNEMTPRVLADIDARLPGAEALRDSAVSLTDTDLDALAAIAAKEVEAVYGSYLKAAGKDVSKIDLRGHMGFIAKPADTSDAHIEEVSKGLIERFMHAQGDDLFDKFNVTLPRDQALVDGCRDDILAQRKDAMKMIALFVRGFETPEGFTFIQRKVAPQFPNEAEERTRRRGRWQTLGTAIHEMLHAVTHDKLVEAAAGIEQDELAIEGINELFTREVYNRLKARAERDAKLRERIEGTTGSFLSPPDRTSGYDHYLPAIDKIVAATNVESLRAAYFMGRVEYLGLGGWNASEAERRYRQRFPAWEIGAAIAIDSDGSTQLARVRVGRVIYGRTGSLQLNLGGTLTYLSPGNRVGLGPDLSLRYEGKNLYVGGHVLLQGSGSNRDNVALEAIPGFEVGAKLGIVRLGVGVDVLLPIAGGGADDRTIKALFGVGASVKFK